MTLGGQRMKVPHTLTAKFAYFPYKFYWKNSQFFRCFAFTFGLVYFTVVWKLDSLVNLPENKRHWAAERAKYSISHFEPVKEE